MSSCFTVSEKNIRDLSQNLKNLLSLSEKSNYPFPRVKYPSNLSTLNAICAYFGFSSVKGMTERLLDETLDPSVEVGKFSVIHTLRKKNPGKSEDEIYEIHGYIESLLENLIQDGFTEDFTNLVSRLRVFELNPVVANVVSVSNSALANTVNPNPAMVIRNVAQGVILFYSQLHTWGTFENYDFENFLKGNQPKDKENLFSLYMSFLNGGSSGYSFEIINFSKQIKPLHMRAAFDLNTIFLEVVPTQLRKNLLLSLKRNTENDSVNILKAFMKLYSHNINNVVVNGSIREREDVFACATDSDEYAQDVMKSLCWGNSKVIKKLEQSEDLQLISHYFFDSNGLLSPKHLPTLLMSLQRVGNMAKGYDFTNLNQLYWFIQLASVDILLATKKECDKVAATYILDVYNNYAASAVVAEHAKELETDFFKNNLKKFKGS